MKGFFKYAIIIVLLVIAWKKGWLTKLFNTLGVTPTSSNNGTNVLSASFSGAPVDSSNAELNSIARNLHESMSGIGMKRDQFLQNIMKIDSDDDFNYVNRQFFVINGKRDLLAQIKKEVLITDLIVNQVNQVFQGRGMTVQIFK